MSLRFAISFNSFNDRFSILILWETKQFFYNCGLDGCFLDRCSLRWLLVYDWFKLKQARINGYFAKFEEAKINSYFASFEHAKINGYLFFI